jgi:hypothetical protein
LVVNAVKHPRLGLDVRNKALAQLQAAETVHINHIPGFATSQIAQALTWCEQPGALAAAKAAGASLCVIATVFSANW